MTAEVSRILEELAPFADLGTDRPQAASSENRLMVRMTRHGEELELQFDKRSGKVAERSLDDDQVRIYASYRSLLASDRFGNLRQWANNQRRSLQNLKSAYHRRIPVSGLLSSSDRELDIDSLDRSLVAKNQGGDHAVRVMLIDGPAGIGKTTFIEFLAWLRADRHTVTQHPLILHVKSRGRILTYVQDLIAFSLQRLRLNLTFDQLPVLVRHGLVTLAIDGFDELADPNGYETAWSQVGELVENIRGNGTLILAGRETFIGQERIRNSIKSLRSTDRVEALTLRSPTPEAARKWLEAQRRHELDFPEELFEFGSFALRPFFLVQLANLPPESDFGDPQNGPLFTSLVKAMIQREASKFGDAIMTHSQGYEYVQRFLREVARYMADDQTDMIDELALSWVAEMAVPEELNDDTMRALVGRAASIAFLEEDDTPTLLSTMAYEGSLDLQNIQADEALIRGTASAAIIHRAGISQLDIQGANVESLEFINCDITTLTVDEMTHVSRSIPLPSQIQYNRLHSDRSKVISSRDDINVWLQAHGRVDAAGDTLGEAAGTIPKDLLNHPMRRLLRRACRSRSFWTPAGSTNYFEKFTRNPLWPDLLGLMREHNLVKEETIAAAGTNSRFFHIKQPIRILTEDMDDDNVKSFYAALVARMRNTA